MFDAPVVMLSGLMELETMNRTVRLCDGGLVNWPGVGLFTAIDSEFGTIGSLDAGAEQIGDEASGGRLTINVPTNAAAVALASAQMQGKALRFWLAEINVQTGALIGTPQKMFEGDVDTVAISLGQNDRTVVIEYVDAAERLFSIREGNVLTSRFHKTAWPGELGFDYCTGVASQVPWGVNGPGRGVVNSGGGGDGGGGAGGGGGGVRDFGGQENSH